MGTAGDVYLRPIRRAVLARLLPAVREVALFRAPLIAGHAHAARRPGMLLPPSRFSERRAQLPRRNCHSDAPWTRNANGTRNVGTSANGNCVSMSAVGVVVKTCPGPGLVMTPSATATTRSRTP